MIRTGIPAATLFLCAACHAAAPRPPISIMVGPAIVEFEGGSLDPTPAAKHSLEQFIKGYRNLEPAFDGVLMCVNRAQGQLPERRAAYVIARLADAKVAPVTEAEPSYCERLGGYDAGMILLFTHSR